jgi:anti-sigma factor RsiW
MGGVVSGSELMEAVQADTCTGTRAAFSAYLDGALDGHSMAQLADHLDSCAECASEFGAWRSVQSVLGELGPAPVPTELQAQLRDALAGEISTGRHLSPIKRVAVFTRDTLAPAGVRLGAGLAAALVLIWSAAWVIGTAVPVQANDDRLAHLNSPQYLYSQTPPEPIATSSAFVAVLVDAKVDARGRVYDYILIDGPQDPVTRLQVEKNLLGGVFKPATVFGVPVPGHVMMTYTAVSVRG